MRNNKLCLIRVKINQPRSKSDILNTTNLFAFTQKYFHPLPQTRNKEGKRQDESYLQLFGSSFIKQERRKKNNANLTLKSNFLILNMEIWIETNEKKYTYMNLKSLRYYVIL